MTNSESYLPGYSHRGQKQIRVDTAKFAYLTSQGILEDFAQGLPVSDRKLVLAVQGQIYGPMFDEKLTVAAWKTKPSWVVSSTKDRMLPPAMERDAVTNLKAIATEFPTCHVARLEQPANVSAVIDDAARLPGCPRQDVHRAQNLREPRLKDGEKGAS